MNSDCFWSSVGLVLRSKSIAMLKRIEAEALLEIQSLFLTTLFWDQTFEVLRTLSFFGFQCVLGSEEAWQIQMIFGSFFILFGFFEVVKLIWKCHENGFSFMEFSTFWFQADIGRNVSLVFLSQRLDMPSQIMGKEEKFGKEQNFRILQNFHLLLGPDF